MLAVPATRPVRTSAVGFEPIELVEAKRQLGLASSIGHHDQDIGDLIKAAREQIEKDASIAIATGTYTYKLTDFGYGPYFELHDLFPITSVSSIAYIASDGTSTTWSASEYSLDTHSVAPIVRLGYSYTWPVLRGDINGITVTVVAGYATAQAVPFRVKAAAKLLVNHWFENRGIIGAGNEIARSYDSLIEGIRREVYA